MRNKIIFSFIFLLFALTIVSAAWPLNKDATCTLLNQTGSSCDQTWCGIISSDDFKCNYNSSLSACLCIVPGQNNVTNQTFIVNNTLNLTDYYSSLSSYAYNKSDTYNRTEIDRFDNNTLLTAKSYTDNLTFAVRDALLGRIDNQSYYYPPVQDDNSWPIYVWVVIGLLVVGIAVYMYGQKKTARVVYQEPTTSIKKPNRSDVKKKANPLESEDLEEEKEEDKDPDEFQGEQE